MKKNLLTLGLSLLLGAMAMPMAAQVVNDDNEDGVTKLNADRSKYDYVQGQVLVKFKDAKRIQVNASRGQFRSTSVNRVTQVLQKFGAEEMEQLLPQENPSRKMRRAKAFNGDVIQERDLSQLYRVKLSENHIQETMQLVDELNAIDEVEFAEPNYLLHTLDEAIVDGSPIQNPLYNDNNQWYLFTYGVTQLWNQKILNPARPVIAIIDTGVDLTHPDLAPNLWTNPGEVDGEKGYDNDHNGFKNDLHGWDFINNTANVRDYNMHGTHVAGIAAAANNGIGIVGANPRALIMPVSVMQSDGTGDVATIVKGINYAVQNGATVLNLSLGTYANARALRQALENAYQSAVIVAAAGNDGKCINSPHHPRPCYGAAPMFPAAYSFVLGVQATQKNGNLAAFSNYDDDGNSFSSVTTMQDPDGFNYELKAPGTEMYSTIPGGKYRALQGTSMASPLVAGAISALKMVKNYDTQEILWGDLLHTNNIAEAFAITARPAELDLQKILFRDKEEATDETEEDYGNDGEIDAGETVYLYPVIRTTFGGASNIRMHLEMGDEFEDPTTVQILTDANHKVNFGIHLDAYGKAVSLNPLVLKVAENVADNRHIKMKFVATCDESNVTYEGKFTMVVTNMVKINGLISENTTLTADHIYLVNDNIGIMEGATLTIEPGTRLEFMEGMGLSSFGKLIAKGTPEKPIVFTGHHGAKWVGIKSHVSTGGHSHDAALYTNDEQTLFTLLPTEETPNKFTLNPKSIYYGANDDSPYKQFYLSNYIPDFTSDMTTKQHLLTDPNYLTSAVLQMLSDWEAYWSQYPTQPSADKQNVTWVYANLFSWLTYDNPRDTMSYCRIEYYWPNTSDFLYPNMQNCIVYPYPASSVGIFEYLEGRYNNVIATNTRTNWNINTNLRYSNIVNNEYTYDAGNLVNYSKLINNNYFNNRAFCTYGSSKYVGKEYWLAYNTSTPREDRSDAPSYLGTGREDIVRPYIYEIGNAPDTYGKILLDNMRTTPFSEAHGIVWKVCVNGKDAQDEYEDLAPLGVGRQKFEVYFNRPMNKAVAPQISFGVRDPWTQNAVAEDGEWNEEGTIYTAYKTITGKTKSDGVNRIYVRGAEDNEYFEIPYEKTRFNVMINAAGSMATGFAAEAKMGRVDLTWNNEENDFEDAMGFNIYRFGDEYEKTLPAGWYGGQYYSEERKIMVADTVRLNTEILDIETTAYTDYDVVPGENYHYYYKVLSTDLQEYDVSNVVAATPLTATLGDADGSGDVKVGDVISTVNYILGENPKPFIFEAADVNTDQNVDVLDVIGIIQLILNQPSGSRFSIESMAQAVYTVEDGVLYIETPVTLAGVQAQLSLNENGEMSNENLAAAQNLKGFEIASTWLTENDYRMLAYSFGSKVLMPGKHAIMTIGDADITSLRLSDTQGNAVLAVPGDATLINDTMGSKVLNTKGVWNLSGQKVSGNDTNLRKGVYIIDGQKIVK